MNADEDDFSSPLIGAWPMLNEAFSPSRLAGDEQEITPGLSALSFLSSRKDYWRPHCLLIEFAIASTETPMDEIAVRSKLNEHALEKWPYDEPFLRHLEYHPYALPKDTLRFTLNLIAQAISPRAMSEAQAGTLKILACLDECDHDVVRFNECLRRP
jgi:hypothetical protein